MSRSLFRYDPQTSGAQYLEDLATAYWYSEVLFTAVDSELFTLLDEDGKSLEEISAALQFGQSGLTRFLRALAALGLVSQHDGRYFNTTLSREHLVKGRELYQGDSILWRRELVSHWAKIGDSLRAGGRVFAESGPEESAVTSERRYRYLRAMDNIAKVKARELLTLFQGMDLKGEMLDVGAGSAAMTAGILAEFPLLNATVADLPEMLPHTRGFITEELLGRRVALLPMNILEAWPLEGKRFELILLSNILHAYSEEELPHIVEQASRFLTDVGLLVIHDFFFEHDTEKAACFDLNMLINTYNGRVFPAKTVFGELKQAGLCATPLLPLDSDTAVIVASKSEEALGALTSDRRAQLASRLKTFGFQSVVLMPSNEIHVAEWTGLKCSHGCSHFGRPNCPPHAPSPERTKFLLDDYAQAFILEGEPPTRNFQKNVLKAEREAFHWGFHKALAFWAGPCTLCDTCAEDGECKNRRDSRPSMEAAGIDVFETVKRAGLSVRTLQRKDEFVKYFALLLLE